MFICDEDNEKEEIDMRLRKELTERARMMQQNRESLSQFRLIKMRNIRFAEISK